MVKDKKMEKYVHDLNWVNNCLHDFARRVAFVDISEKFMKKHPVIKESHLTMSIYNSMANDAVFKICSVYDNKKDVLSIHYLLKWVMENEVLLKSHVYSVGLDFSKKDIRDINIKMEKFRDLIDKFKYIRNHLLGHHNRNFVDIHDIRRSILNNKNVVKENIKSISAEYFEKNLKFLLFPKDFKEMKDKSIEVILDLKNLLKMPDRIFGKSGNIKEWDDFYRESEKEIESFYES